MFAQVIYAEAVNQQVSTLGVSVQRNTEFGYASRHRRVEERRRQHAMATTLAFRAGGGGAVRQPVYGRLSCAMSTDHGTPPGSLVVLEGGVSLRYTYADLMRYHGPVFPGGVAHAFKVLQRALPLLEPAGPAERREITIATAFRGPGARDAFEMVTRAVTDGDRYVLDPGLEQPERGRTLERYVFRLDYRGRTVTLRIRDGFVVDEFIELARAAHRTEAQERRLTVLKQEMADRLLASPAPEVYDVDEPAH